MSTAPSELVIRNYIINNDLSYGEVVEIAEETQDESLERAFRQSLNDWEEIRPEMACGSCGQEMFFHQNDGGYFCPLCDNA